MIRLNFKGTSVIVVSEQEAEKKKKKRNKEEECKRRNKNKRKKREKVRCGMQNVETSAGWTPNYPTYNLFRFRVCIQAIFSVSSVQISVSGNLALSSQNFPFLCAYSLRIFIISGLKWSQKISLCPFFVFVLFFCIHFGTNTVILTICTGIRIP